jgi:thiamine biosynthesis lipoprotein
VIPPAPRRGRARCRLRQHFAARVRRLLPGWCILLLAPLAGRAGEMRRYDFSGPGMGTQFRIAAWASPSREASLQTAVDEAFARLAALNTVFSDYEPGSEINRLCAAAPQPFTASSDLINLTSRALSIAAATDGAFDPAAGALTRLWRSTRRRHRLPPEDRVKLAVKNSGHRWVKLDETSGTITVTRPGVLLDFGGIAKGAAADAMLEILRERGFPRALAQAGGDTAAGEPPPGEDGWRVGLRTGLEPVSDQDETGTFLSLVNAAVSTSGDLHQFIEIDGRRFSHLIDPRTGEPLSRRIAVTVVARSATESDAWATALAVLGPERTDAAVDAGVNARWTWLDETGRVLHQTRRGDPGLPLPE